MSSNETQVQEPEVQDPNAGPDGKLTVHRPNEFLVPQNETATQIGADGRVRVSDAISDQAVSQGHAPDIQPKASTGNAAPVAGVADSALASVLPDVVIEDSTAGTLRHLAVTDKAAAEDIANLIVAKRTAFDALTAQWSDKTDQAVQGLDAAEIGKQTYEDQKVEPLTDAGTATVVEGQELSKPSDAGTAGDTPLAAGTTSDPDLFDQSKGDEPKDDGSALPPAQPESDPNA